MSAKHYPEPEVEVWEENWRAIDLYMRIPRQWRVGAAGAVGLDYGVVYSELGRMGVVGSDFDSEMERIAIIESEALEQFHGK